MNLGELRTAFIKQSGRYDLVSADNVDNGADFYILAGIRFLDRRSTVDSFAKAVTVMPVEAGCKVVQLPDCWRIDEMTFLPRGNSYHIPLMPVAKVGNIRGAFAPMGTPIGYSPVTHRYKPGLDMAGADIPADAMPVSPWFDHLAVSLVPLPNKDGTLTVKGRFYTNALVEDTDENHWSMSHPDLVIKAAMYTLEAFYRNTEGANDWLNTLNLDLKELDNMDVQASLAERATMEGV